MYEGLYDTINSTEVGKIFLHTIAPAVAIFIVAYGAGYALIGGAKYLLNRKRSPSSLERNVNALSNESHVLEQARHITINPKTGMPLSNEILRYWH